MMANENEILVTGGTGRAGSAVVRELQGRGGSVRVLTRGRKPHGPMDRVRFMTGDLTKNVGVERALEGVRVVIHCAASLKWADNSIQTRNLIRAAKSAGVRHLVLVSVVGADTVPADRGLDRVMFGYFAMMREPEQLVSSSGLPWSILRATQFYEAMAIIAGMMAKLPAMPVPAGFRFQPVDTRDVAVDLVDLALGEPVGLAPDVGGPRIYSADALLQTYLLSVRKDRPLIPVPIPGRAASAVRDGAILTPDRAVGRHTWEDFLAQRVAAPTSPSPGVVRS